MLVEIHGAGFRNKGAQLMLTATVSELRERLPGTEAAIDPTYGPYLSRSQLGLYQLMPARSHVGTPGFSMRFRRQKLFASPYASKFLSLLGISPSTYGGVTLSDVCAFIDIAGFAYTDEWGPGPTHDLAVLTSYYKARRKPVVLLPQAFGPFRSPETRSAFRKVLDNATLVFARDEQSYQYISEIASTPSKCKKAPDITLFYPEAIPPVSTPEPETDYACLVPNSRVVDKGKSAWGSRYFPFLLRVIRELLGRGLKVLIVIHDSGGDDLSLGQQLCREACSPAVTLVSQEDPVALKQLIGGSLLLVGSRYHSLLAALSKQVPCLAIGWSHKYERLFQEFGFEDFVFSSPDTALEAVTERVATLADANENLSYRHQIAVKLREMYQVNQRMWSFVADALLVAKGQKQDRDF